jgi:murein DD-endopeptidase MepM/ murein hydrolase activator NlpD
MRAASPWLTVPAPRGKFRDARLRFAPGIQPIGETREIVRGPRRLSFAGSGYDGAMVDLGHEPPLVIGEAEDEAPIRRGVHWRWMTGTILTGFTSIFLMGGALMAALNDPNLFASLPDNTPGIVADNADGMKFGQKGDRMRPLDDVSSRQILQVSTVTRQDERDFIKLRPFAKITASLVAHKELADQVPKYDALSIFAANSSSDDAASSGGGSGAAADDRIYGANVDGEVSVKVTDFPVLAADIDNSVGLDTGAVEQLVRVAANFDSGGAHAGALPLANPAAYADDGDSMGDGTDDPFSALGVRITAENVSNVVKSGADDDTGQKIEEKYISVAKGESFRALLEENGIADEDIDQIVATLSALVDLNKMHVGQKIRLALAPSDADPSKQVPIRLSLYDNGAHQATVARTDSNTFVRADEPSIDEDTTIAEDDTSGTGDSGGLPRVYDAVYETAIEQQVPKPLIDQLIRIFSFDVDFQSRITPGDSMEVLHSLPDPNDKDASEPEVLYASITLGGVTKRFYRYRTGDDGYVDYYDDEGRSAKKFLMRKPMTIGIIRSGFGWRVHPILGYKRLHAGVDYAAPRMTPIMAAGNGVVEKAGPTSGYGNFTLIRHTNGYETGYGHQTSFAKGIVPGAHVRQGQIIGYVGSTGLSTGPHLHFEIRVNGSPVDPLRIRLPRGRVLEGDLLAGFEKERARIDALMQTQGAPAAKVASAAQAAGN